MQRKLPLGLFRGDLSLARQALLTGVNVVLILVTVIGGRIPPSFTTTSLRARGVEGVVRSWRGMTSVTVALMIAIAVVDVVQPGGAVAGWVALAAAIAQGARLVQWQGFRMCFRASDLRLGRDTSRSVRPASVAARWHGHPASAFDLAISGEDIDASDAWPLVLAVAPSSFDRWAGLDPRGTLRQLRADVVRERAGAEPRFQVAADVADLGLRPTARWPGFSGLTARLSGTEQRGRIALRSDQPTFEWPHLFAEPIAVARLEGDADWRRDGRAWILQSSRVAVSDPRVAGECSIALRLPGGGESPCLGTNKEIIITNEIQ